MEVFCLQGAPSFNQITEEDLRCYWGTIRNFDLNRTDFLKFDPARLETIQLSIMDREEKFTNTVVYIPMLATSGLDTKGNIIPLLTTSIISYLAGIVLIPRTYLFLSPGLLLQSTRLNPQEEPNSAQLQIRIEKLMQDLVDQMANNRNLYALDSLLENAEQRSVARSERMKYIKKLIMTRLLTHMPTLPLLNFLQISSTFGLSHDYCELPKLSNQRLEFCNLLFADLRKVFKLQVRGEEEDKKSRYGNCSMIKKEINLAILKTNIYPVSDVCQYIKDKAEQKLLSRIYPDGFNDLVKVGSSNILRDIKSVEIQDKAANNSYKKAHHNLEVRYESDVSSEEEFVDQDEDQGQSSRKRSLSRDSYSSNQTRKGKSKRSKRSQPVSTSSSDSGSANESESQEDNRRFNRKNNGKGKKSSKPAPTRPNTPNNGVNVIGQEGLNTPAENSSTSGIGQILAETANEGSDASPEDPIPYEPTPIGRSLEKRCQYIASEANKGVERLRELGFWPANTQTKIEEHLVHPMTELVIYQALNFPWKDQCIFPLKASNCDTYRAAQSELTEPGTLATLRVATQWQKLEDDKIKASSKAREENLKEIKEATLIERKNQLAQMKEALSRCLNVKNNAGKPDQELEECHEGIKSCVTEAQGRLKRWKEGVDRVMNLDLHQGLKITSFYSQNIVLWPLLLNVQHLESKFQTRRKQLDSTKTEDQKELEKAKNKALSLASYQQRAKNKKIIQETQARTLQALEIATSRDGSVPECSAPSNQNLASGAELSERYETIHSQEPTPGLAPVGEESVVREQGTMITQMEQNTQSTPLKSVFELTQEVPDNYPHPCIFIDKNTPHQDQLPPQPPANDDFNFTIPPTPPMENSGDMFSSSSSSFDKIHQGNRQNGIEQGEVSIHSGHPQDKELTEDDNEIIRILSSRPEDVNNNNVNHMLEDRPPSPFQVASSANHSDQENQREENENEERSERPKRKKKSSFH